MNNANESLIERFYRAFAERDGTEMATWYAPDAHFWDPVFRDLRGAEPGAMWRMLTASATDLRIELLDREADGDRGSAHWLARYTFSSTKRKVVNDVHASFRFDNGLIADHRDVFDFHRWARQALGPSGLFLGWTPMLRGAVHGRARGQLDEFMSGRLADPSLAE
jgi:ketosteroid isomerase-like protein